ncbi:MAG: hypothetical protein SV186_03775 [Candidatus Nanohaloarchaea archaeon]|nr:hypothetical protein [Candidatus Nanohaloarchaea archaeon]
MTVTYIFLQLLPELYRGVTYFGHHAFLLPLAGFTGMHLVEKYIYSHGKDPDELRNDFKELHSIFLFIYHFSLGIIAVFLLRISLIEGVLFFLPVLFHTAASSLSLKELHEDILENTVVRFLVAFSVVLGVGAAVLLDVTLSHYHSLIGVVTGLFMYVVIRDSLSAQGDSRPWGFLAGTLCYTGIILAAWSLL